VWLREEAAEVKSAMEKVWKAHVTGEISPYEWLQHRDGTEDFRGLMYWTRAWMLEEYTLARKIAIWCARICLTGDALDWLYQNRWQSIAEGDTEALPAMRIIVYIRIIWDQ
jgi:hypothetical protein